MQMKMMYAHRIIELFLWPFENLHIHQSPFDLRDYYVSSVQIALYSRAVIR
jgi:hypothetical protein